jgi:hypothetical protein
VKPLVVKCGVPGFWSTVWVENGRGFILVDGQWQALTDAPGLGGKVLDDSKVSEVVREFGRPTP